MTAVFLKLRQCRAVLGHRCFAGEVAVVPVALVAFVWAIGFATAALSPSATEPVPVSSHSGDGRLSQVSG